MNKLTLAAAAAEIGAELVGDGTLEYGGANPLSDAAAGEITLLDDVARSNELAGTQAIAVVVPKQIDECEIAQLIVDNVHAAFETIVSQFRSSQARAAHGIHSTALIDPSADIASDATVGPGCTIGPNVRIGSGCQLVSNVTVMDSCTIGAECHLFPGVVLYENTVIEDRVWIHAGTVVGAYGFGYRQSDGRHVRTAQVGYVHIESDVEVGAAVTIDRGTYGPTKIGTGTKIDNQVMIAHNCHIGRHNLICSQVGIAGSSSTGDYVVLAGQVGLKDHIKLGDGVIVGAQAGVMSDCESGNVYLGSPANKQKEQMQIFAMTRRLPEMRRSLKKLEQTVAGLQSEASSESTAKAA